MTNLPGALVYPTIAERFQVDMIDRTTLAPHTAYCYVRTYRKLQERFPGKRVDQFTAADLVDFLTRLDDGSRRGDSWAPNSVLRHRTALVSLFRWVVKRGYRGDDITLLLKEEVDVVSTVRRHGRWLGPIEIQTLIAHCGGDPRPIGQRDAVVFQLALNTGLRVFELADLTWDRVDLGQGVLQVVKGKGRHGGKDRVVGLTPSLIEVLREWKATFGQAIGGVPLNQHIIPRAYTRAAVVERGARGRFLKGDGRVDVIEWNVGLRKAGFQQVTLTRAEGAGLGHLTAHDLRRSYAGLLENAGVPIQDISKQLGHESVDTTIRYLADNPAKRAAAMANVKLF